MKELAILGVGTEEYEMMDSKARPVLNIEEMKNLDNLVAGNIIKTIGYHSSNDGGGATYLIREKTESDVEDLGLIHFINESLVAELIIHSNICNPVMFGAKHDGVTDDTNAIQKCLNLLHEQKFSILDLLGYTYNITRGLYIDEIHNTIIRNGIIVSDNFSMNTDVTKNFLMYSTDVGTSYEGNGYKLQDVTFENLTLDCNLQNGLGCMYFRTFLRVNITNVNFKRYKTYGFKDSSDRTQDGHEIKMHDCMFNARFYGEENEAGIAIEISKPDSMFSNIIIRGGKTGINIIKSDDGSAYARFNFFSNIHIYGVTEYAIKIQEQSMLAFNQIYFDGCGVYILNPWMTSFTNCLFLGEGFNPITLDSTTNDGRTIAGLKFIGCQANMTGAERIDLINYLHPHFTKSTNPFNINILDVSGNNLNYDDKLFNVEDSVALIGNETLHFTNHKVTNITKEFSRYNNFKIDKDSTPYKLDNSGEQLIAVDSSSSYTYNIINNNIIISDYNNAGYTWLGFLIDLKQNTNYRCLENVTMKNAAFKIIGLDSLDTPTTGVVLKSESQNEILEFNSGEHAYYMVTIFGKKNFDIVVNEKLV